MDWDILDLELNLPQSNKFPIVRGKKNPTPQDAANFVSLNFKLETFHLLDEGNNYYNTEAPELGHLCDTIDFRKTGGTSEYTVLVGKNGPTDPVSGNTRGRLCSQSLTGEPWALKRLTHSSTRTFFRSPNAW